MTEEEHIESPCLRICAVDGKTGFCMGCYRTLKEITTWAKLDNNAKKDLLIELDARKERLGPIGYNAV